MVRTLLATTLALGVALTGCAEHSGTATRPDGGLANFGPAVDPARVGPKALAGTTWRLVSIGGANVDRLHGRLRLGAHRFQADTGVNAISGHLAVLDGQLRLSGVSSTAVGVAGPGSQWEGAQQDALDGAVTFLVEGRTLTLRALGPGPSTVLVYRAT